MEELNKDTTYSVCRYLDSQEIVRLRGVSKKLQTRIDSEHITPLLLQLFPRLRGAHREGETFAQTACRWVMLRVSNSSFSAFFPINENGGVTALKWRGGDQLLVSYSKVVWERGVSSGENMMVDSKELDLPVLHSNVAGNQVAAVDPLKMKIHVYGLGALDKPVETIAATVPSAVLMGAKIYLERHSVILRSAGYRLIYDRASGKMIEWVRDKREWYFCGGAPKLELDEPDLRAAVGDHMVVRHLIDKVARDSLFDKRGVFVGHLDQLYDFYACDGVRLAAGDKKGVHLYRVTFSGVHKEGELSIHGKPTALAFTINNIVVGLKSGTLLRFPLVDPSPKVEKGFRRFINSIKRR